jgi:hypothetical protein
MFMRGYCPRKTCKSSHTTCKIVLASIADMRHIRSKPTTGETVMTAHDPDLISRMTRARELIIHDDLLARVSPAHPALNAALGALAAKYAEGDNDRASAWWDVADLAALAALADLADLADLAYLAALANRAALAALADLACVADLAYVADRADLAYVALVHLAQFLTPMPDLDAQIWAKIKDSPDDTHEQKTWETACGTIYCRGGWAVHLQPYGAALVEVFGWALSAMAIYRQNTGAVPDFRNYNNAAVREEIRAAAAKEYAA